MNHLTGVKFHDLSTTSPTTATPIQHHGEDSLVSAIFQKSGAQPQTSLKRSIWINRQEKFLRVRPTCNESAQILILLCGDIETCPGPAIKYGSCMKTVRKNQSRLCCASCKLLHHIKCMDDEKKPSASPVYQNHSKSKIIQRSLQRRINNSTNYLSSLSYLQLKALKFCIKIFVDFWHTNKIFVISLVISKLGICYKSKYVQQNLR